MSCSSEHSAGRVLAMERHQMEPHEFIDCCALCLLMRWGEQTGMVAARTGVCGPRHAHVDTPHELSLTFLTHTTTPRHTHAHTHTQPWFSISIVAFAIRVTVTWQIDRFFVLCYTKQLHSNNSGTTILFEMLIPLFYKACTFLLTQWSDPVTDPKMNIVGGTVDRHLLDYGINLLWLFFPFKIWN